MPDKPWKAWEREVAKSLGGTRSGPTGRDLPDCIDVPFVAPEAKLYTKFVVLEADFQQAKENAAKIGKIPLLAIKEKKRGGRKRVVMDWSDFLTLWGRLQRYDALLYGGPRPS
jgi:hypothetical protein